MEVKKFKIYGILDEYIVLKCPICRHNFRYAYREEGFGKKIKKAKCQKCEKKFTIENNQLEEDPLFRHWDNRDMIMVKPSGKEEFFAKQSTMEVPELKSANDLN